MKPISKEATSLIENLLRKGYSHHEVARRVHCSTSTISITCKKIKNLLKKRPPGRKCLLSQSLKSKIIRHIRTDACDNAVEINKQLRKNNQLNVCNETICNVSRENGLKDRSKVKKPLLLKFHKKLRLSFAKKHKNFTIEDWKKVI